MTTEQREAIELAKEFTKMDFSNPMGWTGYYDAELEELSQAIDTVLSLIKENSAEIQQKNTELAEKSAEIEKKDKQIDLMANYIVDLIKYNNPEEKREVEEIKQYFERKVEDVKD